jgi:hypothetical protein
MDNKEKMLNNIIGLNPTGTMTYEGTYQFNGHNNTTMNGNLAAKNNLQKTQNNSIECDNIENFENYENYIIKKKNFNKNNKLLFLIFLFIIIYFLLILI